MQCFDGYVRVSATKGRGGDSFISPDVQRDTIRRLADAKGIEIGEIAQELDVSGGKRIEERELGRLIEKIERGESDGVIVWRLSRFSRNLLDAVEAITRINAAGGRLIADDFDSRQSMSKALLGLLAGLAEEELDARRAGWDEAHRRAVERGVGMSVPIGYRKGVDGRLVVDTAEAKNVREAFRMRAESESLSTIARRIGRSHVTVHDMLRNETYLGVVSYGPYRTEDAHPALVDRALFNAAGAARTSRPAAPGKLTKGRLLQGLARCAGCGHTLKVVHRPTKTGSVSAYYCKNAAKLACGDRAFIAADLLDEFVEDWFARALRTVPQVVDVVAANRELEQAQGEASEADADLVAYVEAASALDKTLFQRGLVKRQQRVSDAHALVNLRSASVAKIPAGGRFLDLWDGFDRQQRREVLLGFLDRVIVRKGATGDLAENLSIVWSDGTVADHEQAVGVLAA